MLGSDMVFFYQYPSGLLYWHWGICVIATIPNFQWSNSEEYVNHRNLHKKGTTYAIKIYQTEKPNCDNDDSLLVIVYKYFVRCTLNANEAAIQVLTSCCNTRSFNHNIFLVAWLHTVGKAFPFSSILQKLREVLFRLLIKICGNPNST